MLIPFSKISEHAKVRVYTAERAFSPQETELIEVALCQFLSQWVAHGKPLHAGGAVLHNRFLILATDETLLTPSGCSLDAFTSFLKEIEKTYNISLLNHALVAYRQGATIIVEDFKIVKEKLRSGALSPDTLMFDHRILQVWQLQNKWEIPIRNSWLEKFLTTSVV